MSEYTLLLLNYKDSIVEETPIDVHLYRDDNIEELKYKVSLELDLKDTRQYYFFYKKKTTLKPYAELKKYFNRNYVITKEALGIFLSNYDLVLEIPSQDTYTMDDLVKINFPMLQTELEPLGIHIREKIYSVNPFLNDTLYDSLSEALPTRLLLDYPNMNTIYLVKIGDLSKYISQHIKTFSKVYFPDLYKSKDFELEAVVNPDYSLKVGSITKHKAFFNDSIEFKENIKSLSCLMYPKEDVYIPVDLLFKVMHSTADYPMVQLKLEREQEQMLRLFTNDYSTNHMAIPFLPKTNVVTLSKHVRKQTLQIVINGPNQMTFEINHDGQILLHIGRNTIQQDLEQWIQEKTSALIDIIIQQFDPGQNIFRKFNGFSSKHIELIKMNYDYELRLTRKIDPTNIKNYFNYIFNYNGDSHELFLKYIRVANYMESDNIRSRILYLIRENYDTDTILKNVRTQFPNVDVEKKMKEVYELTDMKEGVRRKKRAMISPGIDIVIKYKKMDGDLYVYHVEIMDITNYSYIDVIKVYLSNLFRILIGESPTGLVETEKINPPMEYIKSEVVYSEEESENSDDVSDVSDVPDVPDDVPDDVSDVSDVPDAPDDVPDEEVIEIEVEEPPKPLEDINEDSNTNSFNVLAQYKRGGAPQDVVTRFKNRYPFLSALKKSDKKMFGDDYSRKCPAQERRQPIVLTNEEKKKIESVFMKEKQSKEAVINKLKRNEKWTDADKKILKDNLYEKDYIKIKDKITLDSSDKQMIYDHLSHEEKIPAHSITEINNKHYMCSLYWDFNKDVPMSQTKANKLAKHIFSETKYNLKNPIPDDKYIFKIFRDQFPNKDTIGLLKGNRPCCFLKPKTETVVSSWILDHSKIILDENRLGHLTENLSTFFKYDSRKKINDKHELIEDCLLRKGMGAENTFLKSIAKIFGYSDTNYLIESIVEKVNLDTLLTFHNGKLPSLFYNAQGIMRTPNVYTPLDDAYVVANYSSYALYKKMIHNKKGLYRIINGLENFHIQLYKYMDYVYVWDIIASGVLRLDEPDVPINMIILNDVNDDTTHKIELICPRSDYSNYMFDTDKYSSFILYLVKDNYQPIVLKKKKEKKKEIDELYIFKENTIVQQLTKFLKQINYDKCGPRRKTDDYKMNITFGEIMTLLPEDYKVKRQLVNYNGQVIAGLIEYKDELFYLPCRPTSILPEIPYYVMGQPDEHIFNDYASTFTFLKELKRKVPDILCDLVLKVKHEGKIIGFLTETNQFIGLSLEEEDMRDDGLEVLEDRSYLEYDKVVSEENTEPWNGLFRLKLEERFYALFFQKLKILLSDLKLFVKKRSIMDIITQDSLSLNEKIDKIHAQLEEYIHMYFEFTDIDAPLVEDLIAQLQKELPYKDGTRDIIDDLNKQTYTENDCFLETQDKKCILPLYNLYTKEPNHTKYIKVFAENIIRNYKIYKSFFYESYIVNPVKSYRLNKNEILLFQSNLEQYYEQLEDINKYKKYYDISPTKFEAFLDYAQKTRDRYREALNRDERRADGPDTRADTRAETRANTRADTRMDTRADTRMDTRANIIPESRPEIRTDTRMETRANIIPESRPDTRADTRTETRESPAKISPETRIEQNEAPIDVARLDARLESSCKVFTEDLHRADTESEYKELIKDDCVEKNYFGNKTKWKIYFPKYTTYLRFHTNTNDCNYLLLNYIDKCQMLETTQKQMIKARLLKIYEKINFDKLLPYLKADGKTITDKAFIQDETYALTLTDMILYCYFYQLPVVFCRLERVSRTKKFDVVLYDYGFTQSPFRYYIRIMNNKQFDLLYYYKSGIKISGDIFGQTKPVFKYLKQPIEDSIGQLYV